MWIRAICGRISSASLFCVFREICGSLIKAAWEKFIAEKKTPTESTELTELLAERILPQISQIYTDG